MAVILHYAHVAHVQVQRWQAQRWVRPALAVAIAATAMTVAGLIGWVTAPV